MKQNQKNLHRKTTTNKQEKKNQINIQKINIDAETSTFTDTGILFKKLQSHKLQCMFKKTYKFKKCAEKTLREKNFQGCH